MFAAFTMFTQIIKFVLPAQVHRKESSNVFSMNASIMYSKNVQDQLEYLENVNSPCEITYCHFLKIIVAFLDLLKQYSLRYLSGLPIFVIMIRI